MINKLYVKLMNSETEKNLDWAEQIRNRDHNQSCWNTENQDCNQKYYADMDLVDADWVTRNYPMCKSCYNSWALEY